MLFGSFATMMSYDYVPLQQSIDATTNVTQYALFEINMSNVSYVNDNSSVTTIIQPHYLIDNRYIRLAVGIIGVYLAISFLYSNTLSSKLPEFDTHG